MIPNLNNICVKFDAEAKHRKPWADPCFRTLYFYCYPIWAILRQSQMLIIT